MTAVEKTIPAAAKNPQAPAKVRFQEFISGLRLVWKRKITNQSAFLILKNWVWWKAANAAQEPDIRRSRGRRIRRQLFNFLGDSERPHLTPRRTRALGYLLHHTPICSWRPECLRGGCNLLIHLSAESDQ
jgi:hypothetical protein